MRSKHLGFGILAAPLVLRLSSSAPAALQADTDALIRALFDAGGFREELDANGDGRLDVADLTGLVLQAGAVTPTGTAPATATATPTATRTTPPTVAATATAIPERTPTSTLRPPPTFTASASRTASYTGTPTATRSPSPSLTATSTPAPDDILFEGVVADLVPHAVGDRLVYRVTGPGTQSATETIEVVSQTADGTFVAELKRDLVHERQEFRDSGLDLHFLAVTNVPRKARTTCEPALIRLHMPVRAGDYFSTASQCTIRYLSGIYLGRFSQTDEVMPVARIETLAVPAGTYALVIHIHGTTTVDMETNDYYVAPGVGVVRRVSVSNSGTVVRELIDGTVGGKSVKR